MKVMIIGSSSKVSACLKQRLVRMGFDVLMAGRSGPDLKFDGFRASKEQVEHLVSEHCSAYIINMGVLYSKTISCQTIEQIEKSFHINLIAPVRVAEEILSKHRCARIFIIGSESGAKGSFDTSYFLAKSGLRAYVRERALAYPTQQLLLFSPSTISDAYMTTSRTDSKRLAEYLTRTPKGRFLTSDEVAGVVASFLNVEFEYFSNTEIELNGGKFARMGRLT